LQKIWDSIYGDAVPHRIEVNDSVFQVVCHSLTTNRTPSDSCNPQTAQRISDTWRSRIGSTAIAIINSFFDSAGAFETDESRREFARNALEKFDFIYDDATSSNRKVNVGILVHVI
jgi:hypothetical protein